METIRAAGAIDLAGASTGALASLCRVLVPVMAVIGALCCWWAVGRRASDVKASLIDGVAMVIVGIWIASPVLSPQYLVWGLPVFLFVNPTTRVLYLVALGITRIVYPACYPFVAAMELPGIVIVTIRNALLIAAWAALLRHWLQPSTSRPSDIASVRLA